MTDLLNVYADMPLASQTSNGQARDAALQASASIEVEATSLVDYRSAGHVLIVGPGIAALDAASRLPGLQRTVLISDSDTSKEHSQLTKNDPTLVVLYGRLESLRGHLGHYTAMLRTARGESLNLAELNNSQYPFFDLVLDLQPSPQLNYELPPFGYYPVGGKPAMLERALLEIPEMVGEFEKPKYFNYNPDICAHGDSGLTGCSRCLEVCPTLAITSAGDHIEVDPFLCQGGGSCTAACPTGAIIYAYPGPKDQIARIRAMLKAYRDTGGEQPMLLFHDAAAGEQRLRSSAADLPERVIPVLVEEIGAVGMDIWLSSLAYGASEVVLLDTDEVTPAVRHELDRQLVYARALLEAMGYDSSRLYRLAVFEGDLADWATRQSAATPVAAAAFDTFNEKRGTLRLALDHLYEQASAQPEETALPLGAPFGQVFVARDACTLCMSCAQVCPTSALHGEDDRPQLNFTEDRCVQCGLCEKACPEEAITLAPRFLFDWEQRRRPRVLNEEEPFCCLDCGTPFGTASVVGRMAERLQGHAMFQSEAALRRLKLCADCRVADMFAADITEISKPKVYGQ